MEHLFEAMRPLIRWMLRRAWLVALIGLTLAALGLWRTTKLSVDTDLANLLPPEYPAVQALETLRSRVGGGSSADVAISSPSFEANKRFAEAYIEAVMASQQKDGDPFFTRVDYRRETDFLRDNALYFATEAELDQLEQYLDEKVEEATLEANPFFFDLDEELEEEDIAPEDESDAGAELARTFNELIGKEYPISDDSTTMVLRFYPAEGDGNLSFIEDAYADLETIAAGLNPASFHPDMEITYAGRLQRQMVELHAITDDVKGSLGVGIMTVLLVVVLYFLYKSYRARAGHHFNGRILLMELARTPVLALIIGLPLAMSLLWTFGIAQLTIGALNLMTTTLGLVLFGLGIDYGIHFYARYTEERGRGLTVEDAAEKTFVSNGQAIATSALTTAAALYVLTIADFRGFSEFGFIAGTGILLALIAMLFFMPTFLALAERARLLQFSRTAAPLSEGLDTARRYRGVRPVLVASLVAVVVAIVFLPRVSFEYHFGKLEPVYTEFNERQDVTRQVYNSSRRNPAYILLDHPSEAPGVVAAVQARAEADTLNPVIRSVEALSERFPLMPETQRARLDRIAHIRERLDDPQVQEAAGDDANLTQLRRAAQTRVPISMDEVPDFLREQFTDKQGRIGTFVIVYPGSDLSDARRSIRLADLIGTIEANGKVYHAGSTSIIAAEMLRLLQREAPMMIGLTLLFIFLLKLIAFRSLKWTLLALLPLIVGLLWMIGLMELFALKLNFYNLVALPAILGIGDDCGVHIVHRYREEGRGSILAVLRSTGEHITMGALTTMIGFGGLMLSFHPGLRSLGLLAVLGVGSALIAALTFLPALLQWLENRQEAEVKAPVA